MLFKRISKSFGLTDLTALSLGVLLSQLTAMDRGVAAGREEALTPPASQGTEATEALATSTTATTQTAKEGERQRAPASTRSGALSQESEEALRGAVSRMNQLMDSAAQSAASTEE